MSDIDRFLNAAKTASGEYSFSVLLKDFREAVNTVHITSITKNNPNIARIEVYKETIKISSYNSISFSEYIIPAEVAEGVPDFRFNLDQNMLVKVVSAFSGEETLSFDIDTVHMVASVSCGKTTLEMSVYPDTDFVDFSARMRNPESKGSVDTDSARKIIQFIAQFARKDDAQPQLSLVEFGNGCAVGGTAKALAYVKSDSITYSMKLRFELISQMDKFLPHFTGTVELFETKTHYMLADENILCGFEKVSYKFPPVEPILNAPTDVRVLTVPRGDFHKALSRLSIMNSIEDLILHITTSMDGTMTLYTQDDKGRKSTDCLSISVSEDTTQDDKTFNLALPAVIRAVQTSSSESLTIKTIPNKLAIIRDEREDGVFISVFSMVTGI